ncbi:unnamed protein product [Penicillium glandicola]
MANANTCSHASRVPSIAVSRQIHIPLSSFSHFALTFLLSSVSVIPSFSSISSLPDFHPPPYYSSTPTPTVENDKESEKAIEGATVIDEAKTVKDGVDKPEPNKRKKKSQAYFERRKALAQASQLHRQERRRLREAGIEMPPRARDPAPSPRPTQESTEAADVQTPEIPAASKASLSTIPHPENLEDRVVSNKEDEEMGGEDVEMDLGPVGVTLPFRGKASD